MAMLQLIADRVDDPTAKGISVAIGALINSRQLAPGDHLPTVRALAAHLHVSPSTVTEAWRILQRHGAIETDRRRGTIVRSTRAGVEGRYWQVPVEPGTIETDLSTGTPDPNLLPPLGPVLGALQAESMVSSYNDRPVLPELEAELRRRWPCDPAALTVVDGAQDALDRLVSAHIRLGDVVVVEDPAFPALLDMLDLAGAQVVAVPVDRHGMVADALARALAQDPRALFLQPRAHNPTGASLDARRAGAIAELIAPTATLVVEDDHSATVSGTELHCIAQYLPDRVVHVRSFSKTHGPDLRVAAIGGPVDAIDPVVTRRRLGPSWTSRLTQQILLAMLRDEVAEGTVGAAAAIYRKRRSSLVERLRLRGVQPAEGDGLNVWIPVRDEQRTVVALAAQSIGVAPGAPFRVESTSAGHIRVSLGAAPDDLEAIADAIAAAARR